MLKATAKYLTKLGGEQAAYKNCGWTFWRLGGFPTILTMKIPFQSILKFVLICFSKFISNISLMLNQSYLLCQLLSSPRLLQRDLNHQLNKVETGSKHSPHTWILVCRKHTKSGRSVAESDNMTAAVADVSLAADRNAA